MAEPTFHADVQGALAKLADVSVPQPVSWMPQTWGWVAVALIVAAALLWAAWAWIRRRRANRYRREALAELAALEAQLEIESQRAEAMATLPPLLKRVALAAWPRKEVAALAGDSWVQFLRQHASGAEIAPAMARLLDDVEYQSVDRKTGEIDEARECIRSARQWIERHRVPA